MLHLCLLFAMAHGCRRLIGRGDLNKKLIRDHGVDREKCCEHEEGCTFPFTYKGKTYQTCTTEDSDHDRPWCKKPWYAGNNKFADWAYCKGCIRCNWPGGFNGLSSKARSFRFDKENVECDGSNVDMGYKKTVKDCADTCNGTSKYFVYSKNSYRCHHVYGCNCYCETVGNDCEQIDNLNYDLYVYTSEKINWEPHKTNAECGGSEIYVGQEETVQDCAEACNGTSKYFILSKDSYKCDYDGCACYCETVGDSCEYVDRPEYDLYEIKPDMMGGGGC